MFDRERNIHSYYWVINLILKVLFGGSERLLWNKGTSTFYSKYWPSFVITFSHISCNRRITCGRTTCLLRLSMLRVIFIYLQRNRCAGQKGDSVWIEISGNLMEKGLENTACWAAHPFGGFLVFPWTMAIRICCWCG